jgi:hypothetical protein
MAERAIGEMAIFYGDKQNNGQYDNGVWMDLLDIPYLRKIEEASLYKTVIRTLWLESIGWSKEIRNRYPHVRLIGLSDHPLSTHISKLPANQQHLDGIMALTEEERQWYQVAVPSIPVEYVGLPFPFERYEELYGSFRSQEKKYIGLGVGAADNDRNFVSNILAFRKLQLRNPDLVGVFLSVPDQLIPYCSYWADLVDNMYIHQRNGMADFYKMLSQCKLVINLADRNTPGRLQGEAAFFNVPVVGSNRLELQRKLFPDLAVSPDQGIEANYKIHQFNYGESLKRFNNLIKRIEDGD